jgi:hypothetical protein
MRNRSLTANLCHMSPQIIVRSFVLAVILGAVPCAADLVPLDGTWVEFRFNGPGSFATACAGACSATTNPVAVDTLNPPWTFSGPAQLTVVDLFNLTDSFDIFDFGALLGTTSAPGGGDCGDDIGGCLANPNASFGVFNLGGGNHSITIQQVLGTPGAAAFQVTPAAVPEPSTLSLAAAGILLAGFSRRRRLFGRS